jgi:hypothetical protein
MDPLTLLLGQVFGIYFALTGLSMLIYFRELKEAVEEFAMSKMLFYLTGHFLFVIGLLVVLLHTSFDGILAIMVTILGYLTLLKGVLILLLPHSWVGSLTLFFNKTGWYITTGILSIAVGGSLIFITFALPLIA